MRATIRDVAEAAGVSAMAVSAVLNGTGSNVKVSAERAEHIRKVAHELRYQPNNVARSLRSRQTHMVAVVFQHFEGFGEEHPYYPQLLNGVMRALFPAKYTLGLCPKLNQGDDARSLSDGRFDGVLWCRPDFTAESVEHIQNATVPVVMVHAPPGSVPGVPSFCADNTSAMRGVAQHLASLGHQRVAYLIDPISAPSVEGRERARAFHAAAAAAGMNSETLVWDHDVRPLEDYVGGGGPHTALVCFGDATAGRVLKRCEELGISVPDQLSVVGFDSSSFCESTRPRLTSVNQPVERMAYDATKLLLTLIREGAGGQTASPTVSSIYDCGLDVRDSTGPVTHRRAIL